MQSVEQQRRELNKHAYLLISKYLAAANKEGQETFDFRRNLRKKDALDIDLSTNKEVLAEVSKFKESGGAALLTAGSLQASSGLAGAVKAAKSRGATTPLGGGAAAGLPPLAAGTATRPKAGGSRPGAKGGKPDPSTLPAKIGCKVNRWWPNEGQWFTAVITDFTPETNEYRLTYNLGSANETYEDLDLDLANPQEYEMTGEKVNLLAQKGSAAVNNSSVLQPFLAKPASGSKSKKRKSKSSDEDEDYFD